MEEEVQEAGMLYFSCMRLSNDGGRVSSHADVSSLVGLECGSS